MMLLCIKGFRPIGSLLQGRRGRRSETGLVAVAGASRTDLATRIATLIQRCRDSRLKLIQDHRLRPEFQLLASWQSRRLSWTHRDLLASERFGPATRYFFSDLYGDRDYTPRDEGMERVLPVMIRVMPSAALESIAMGLDIHALTQELDFKMTVVLRREFGPMDRLSAEQYAHAYRLCDNAADRERQILLISDIGRALDGVVHYTLVYNAVRLARRPAHLAGFGALHDFIERGFVAFRHMERADEFLETIERRELAIMHAILAERPVAEWAIPSASTEQAISRTGGTPG